MSNENLIAWFKSLNYPDVTPINVTIWRTKTISVSFEGVQYTDRNGDISYYLLGDIRSLKQSNGRYCFAVTDNGEQTNYEAFIASYSNDRCLLPPYDEYHPFGHSMIVHYWQFPDRIDQYEEFPYRRLRMEIERSV
jgi:hypothetical protein